MPTDSNRFVLYEYLDFFWKKKWVFVSLPLLGIIVALGLTFLQDNPYVGTVTVYTGDIKGNRVQPDLIKEDIKTEYTSAYTIEIADKRVIFKTTSMDKAKVEKILDDVSGKYFDLIEKESDEAYKNQTKIISILNKQIDTSEKLKEYHFNQIKRGDLPLEEEKQSRAFILSSDEQLREYIDDVNDEEKKLLNFEKPQKLDMVISKENNFLISNILLGLVLGFFLSVCLIILWKYIIDAKKATNSL